jgi:signal transduction histidine kinase
VAPLVVRQDDVIGVIVLGHPASGVFTCQTARIIAGIAAQAAVAIHHAQVREHTQRISEELARRLELERVQRVRRDDTIAKTAAFLAGLSHDLREPLNAILGWSEVLLASGGDGSNAKGLEAIARNARAQGDARRRDRVLTTIDRGPHLAGRDHGPRDR